jgi:hypothetical protein
VVWNGFEAKLGVSILKYKKSPLFTFALTSPIRLKVKESYSPESDHKTPTESEIRDREEFSDDPVVWFVIVKYIPAILLSTGIVTPTY